MSSIGTLINNAILASREFFVTFFVPPPPSPVARQQRRKTISFRIVRPQDLLCITADGYNLLLDTTNRQLVADEPGDSFLAVKFPSQNIAEEAFLEDGGTFLVDPPVRARAALGSRVVLHLHSSRLPLDYTAEAILDVLSTAAPLVSDRLGNPAAGVGMGQQAWFGGLRSQVTSIEAPWRLILSPHPDTRWAHSSSPVSHGKYTELWHSRMAVAGSSTGDVDEKTPMRRTVRAIYTPDFSVAPDPDPKNPTPFSTSLRRSHRRDIVRLSSDRTLAGNTPVAVRRLHLSALGAEMDLLGHWNSSVSALASWLHQASVGRDYFVRTVERGFLFPLGHRASLITITERKLAPGEGHNRGPYACLRQRIFIIVREPVKLYSHRAFPFRQVTMRTLITPDLVAQNTDSVQPPGGKETAFWPKYTAQGIETDVRFAIDCVDREDRLVSFDLPLIFVFDSTSAQPDTKKIVDAYNGVASVLPAVPETGPRRTQPLHGQKVAFAPPNKRGDTTLDTDSMTLGALNALGLPGFLPAMRGAQVAIPAVREMTGQAGPQLIRFERTFLDAAGNTFGNAGEIFARIESPRKIAFAVEKIGGIATPDLTPQGLSRFFGPVGDVDGFAAAGQGGFDASKIFSGVTILGGIDLGQIFKIIPFSWPQQADIHVPGLTTTRTVRNLGSGDEAVIETRYVWNAKDGQIKQWGMFTPEPGVAFKLESWVAASIDGARAAFEATGQLDNFAVKMPPDHPLIGATFDHIKFAARSGHKLDVSVKFNRITFENELSFIDKVREYIPLDGFIDPPSLDVTPQGLTCGYTLGLPTIGFGIFVLQNISLSAGFHLPFVGGAAGLRFAFCERDHPFLLTVMAFGGGGFFGVGLTTKEITDLEASLEFGAAVAINLGVASGKASITGGIYYQKSGAVLSFLAFFRAAGSLSILGIVTVSVELYIALGFKSKSPRGGTLYGTASVKVKIKIAFFSKSVSVSMERELSGTDPTFIEMVRPADWAEYCGAFALEP